MVTKITLTDLLIKIFIKNPEQTKDNHVRESYGLLGSIVGMICNVVLFLSKLLIGIFINSVAIMADSFNNLSDAFSNIVAYIGFKMSGRPPDTEHPFGHGRIEYISSLIVSFVILLIGWEFLKTSISKIISPKETIFSIISIIILLLTVIVKLWMYFFNKKLGQKIKSTTLLATAKDSLNDVLVTLVTIISIIVAKYTGLLIDGYVGLLVSGILIYGGYSIAKETLSPLLGESAPFELANKIKTNIENYEGIVGTHDLIVHNYGPNKSMATIHAEVPNNVDIEVSHAIIDRIEREIQEDLGIYLLIHMDPIAVNDQRIEKIKETTKSVLDKADGYFEAHDFRLVNSHKITNVIFDLTIPFNYNSDKLSKIINEIKSSIKEINDSYNTIINLENGFTVVSEYE